MARQIAPGEVRAMIADGGEVAILDLREELAFSEGHLLHARALPLSPTRIAARGAGAAADDADRAVRRR